MNNQSQSPITFKEQMIFVGLILFMIVSTIGLFPMNRIDSKELADNPDKCAYYISLHSVLANYPAFKSDNSNVKFIKDKMLQFEKDIAVNKASTVLLTPYKTAYLNVLNTFGVSSIANIIKPKQVLTIAKKSYPIIDNYYFDGQVSCVNPLIYPASGQTRRILQFNLGSLYDELPNRFSRIVVAFPNDSQLGAFPGYFVNNQTTTLETQFMTGLPLLTALYVMPKFDYANVGSYNTPVPWGYFNSNTFTNPVTRKLFDIAGIDVFSLLPEEMAAKNITHFADTLLLKNNQHPSLGRAIRNYANQRSYGTAYLANSIHHLMISDVKPQEEFINHYFAQTSGRDAKAFSKTTDFFYDKLMGLQNKNDILLEDNSQSNESENMPAGSVQINNIVGERAFFNADCLRTQCTFVWNIANSPGWHAFVNGKSEKINRANFAFSAVTVPHGQSTVWFIYQPITSLLSYFISILTLIGIFRISGKRNALIH